MKTETTNTQCPICGGKMDVKHVMNTVDSDTNKTTIFLEYMNEIYVNRDFYSRGKIIEMAKDKYVELHGSVNNDEELKDTIVSIIKQRIESEYRKHPDLDWAGIAARKIYAELKERGLVNNAPLREFSRNDNAEWEDRRYFTRGIPRADIDFASIVRKDNLRWATEEMRKSISERGREPRRKKVRVHENDGVPVALKDYPEKKSDEKAD